MFGGLKSFNHEHCLDPGEVSTDFQQKWQVHVHGVTAGDLFVRISIYCGEVHHHGTRVVKIHN